MKDIQNSKGDFIFKIDNVGVDSFLYPISIKARDGSNIYTIANFSLSVSLEKTIRGINMSRLPIFVSELDIEDLSFNNMKKNLIKLRDKLESREAKMGIQFEYFINKKAPVSKHECIMNYSCTIDASIISNDGLNEECDIILTVEVPVTTLCPCSKEISDYSAHNQRSFVSVSVRYNNFIWIEEIIDIVESVASCEIYPVLKRIDEKFVTEKAYDNPRFVEDIVRLVAEKLYYDNRITWFNVKSRHMESIHRHNAFAEINYLKNT